MEGREKEEVWEWGTKEGGTKVFSSPWIPPTQGHNSQTWGVTASYLSPLQKKR